MENLYKKPTPEDRVAELSECARLTGKPFLYADGDWDNPMKIVPHHDNIRVLERLRKSMAERSHEGKQTGFSLTPDKPAHIPDLVNDVGDQPIAFLD